MEARTFSSYRSLFRIRYAIHRVGEMPLPFEIPLDALIIFGALYFPLYPLGWLFSLYLYPGHPHLVNFILTAVLSRWAAKADPQGKSLPEFLAGLAAYLIRPKRVDLAGRRVAVGERSPRRHALDWRCWEISE